jgi:hypothetical protein
MGENPALFTKRKKSFEEFEVGDKVKVLPPPHLSPGIDVDEDAIIAEVESKDERKKTIRVKGKNIDPAKSPVYKKAGRRARNTRRRRHPRRK